MPDEEDNHFDLLLEEAETAAENESKTLSGRVRTAGFFTARKQLKKGPAKVVTAALEHIPFVGPTLGAASGTLQGIVRNKRVKKKGLHAVCTATYTSSSAKDCAKALGLLATKIDENLTKQASALASFHEAIDQLNALEMKQCSYEEFIEKFWTLIYCYYRVDHYNVKLAKLVDDTSRYAGGVQNFVETQNHELKQDTDLKSNFLEMSAAFLGDDQPLLRGRGSSSSQ